MERVNSPRVMRQLVLSSLYVASACAAILAVVAFPAGALASQPGSGLFTVAADGSGLVKLAPKKLNALLPPTWSPDGKQLAFYSSPISKSRQGGAYYRVESGGSGTYHRLTPAKTTGESAPAWSPDGKRIAFTGSTKSGKRLGPIGLVTPDGSHRSTLVARRSAADVSNPVWSPDGKKVAFVRGTYSQGSIYVIGARRIGLRRITKSTLDQTPIWSPDGKKIAFVRGGTQGAGLYVVNADGSELKLLQAKGEAEDIFSAPTWSPDSSKLAFDKNGTILTISVDGSALTPLSTKQDDHNPQWSPDGTKILFTRNTGGSDSLSNQLYTMAVDGTQVAQLTNYSDRNQLIFGARWSPSGTAIAFTRYKAVPEVSASYSARSAQTSVQLPRRKYVVKKGSPTLPIATIFQKYFSTIKTNAGASVLLPSKVKNSDKKQHTLYASGKVTAKGYDLELAYTQSCSPGAQVCSVGSFRAEKSAQPKFDKGSRDEPVQLTKGIKGYFSPASCGASCSAPGIQWIKGKVLYTVYYRGGTGSRKFFVDLANSAIMAGER